MEGLTRLNIEPALTFTFLVSLQGTAREGSYLDESLRLGLSDGCGLGEHGTMLAHSP